MSEPGAWSTIKGFAREQIRAAPIGISMTGSVIFGALLVFGSLSFNEDPAVSRALARMLFRALGVVFMLSPVVAGLQAWWGGVSD